MACPERQLMFSSHIFCLECANRLQLSHPPAGQRPVCPACDAHLTNPDDAVITNLNPTEDYKTSLLSGLSPGIIMECAGRGLSFWTYQTSQEVYVPPTSCGIESPDPSQTVSSLSRQIPCRQIQWSQFTDGQNCT